MAFVTPRPRSRIDKSNGGLPQRHHRPGEALGEHAGRQGRGGSVRAQPRALRVHPGFRLERAGARKSPVLLFRTFRVWFGSGIVTRFSPACNAVGCEQRKPRQVSELVGSRGLGATSVDVRWWVLKVGRGSFDPACFPFPSARGGGTEVTTRHPSKTHRPIGGKKTKQNVRACKFRISWRGHVYFKIPSPHVYIYLVYIIIHTISYLREYI